MKITHSTDEFGMVNIAVESAGKPAINVTHTAAVPHLYHVWREGTLYDLDLVHSKAAGLCRAIEIQAKDDWAVFRGQQLHVVNISEEDSGPTPEIRPADGGAVSVYTSRAREVMLRVQDNPRGGYTHIHLTSVEARELAALLLIVAAHEKTPVKPA